MKLTLQLDFDVCFERRSELLSYLDQTDIDHFRKA